MSSKSKSLIVVFVCHWENTNARCWSILKTSRIKFPYVTIKISINEKGKSNCYLRMKNWNSFVTDVHENRYKLK